MMMITGDKSRTSNPTKYREPSFYDQLLHSVSKTTEDAAGKQFVFEVVICKCLQTYVKV